MSKHDMLSIFHNPKPIIGVIHCKGDSDADVMERAKREIAIYQEYLDGILVETYFGTYHQVEQVLAYLESIPRVIPYGINCLKVEAMCFELAIKYHCDFMQIDSVASHLKDRDNESLDAFYNMYRAKCPAKLLGGVRFKYQPVRSTKTVAEDLHDGMRRCDAICVTQDETGQETEMGKIREFREAIGDFPLFVCAGVTPKNVREQLSVADGAVVGSYFKDTYKDTGDVCAGHVQELMAEVKKLREEGGR